MKTIHIDITYFCNYHCEYCYQGMEKSQLHISDNVYKNLLIYLEKNKSEPINLVLIGGEPFLYPNFFELVEKAVSWGHYITVATNFSMPESVLERFLSITDGHIARFKISLHLSQVKNIDKFIEKVAKLKTRLSTDVIRVGSVVTEENFSQLREIEQRLKSVGLNFLYQRIFDDRDYCIYSDEIEDYLAKNDCVDIRLDVVKKGDFGVIGKVCSCGNDFYKILIDGTVTRCFTKQIDGYDIMGNMEKSDNIKKLSPNMPCLSESGKCRCYFHFMNDGQLKPNHEVSRFKLLLMYIIPAKVSRLLKKVINRKYIRK